MHGAGLVQKRFVAGTAVTLGGGVDQKRGVRAGLRSILGPKAFHRYSTLIGKGWCAFGRVKTSQNRLIFSMASGSEKDAVLVWLGSGSASRHALMKELIEEDGELMTFMGKVSADIDEKAIRYDDPERLVLALAHAKADAILDKENGFEGKDGYLITCDQVVLHKGCILEKPEDEGEARRMIAGYAEAPASTVGSTVVTHVRSGKRVERVDTATVCFNLVVIEVCVCVYMRHRGVCVCVCRLRFQRMGCHRILWTI